MLEKIPTCPACASDVFENHITCKDHMLTGESFTITQCTQCGLLFTNPRPLKQNLNYYYKSDQYISHTDKSNNIINSIYRIARKYTLSSKVKLVSRLSDKKNILDFGCGTGDFLLACKTAKWEINGFEPDNAARQTAQNKTEITLLSDIHQLKNLTNTPIVTLWHVLEHIPNLNETIATLKDILSKKGQLVIAVPNHKSYDASYYKEFWAAYDVPRHLYHFDRNTMEILMHKHSLKINTIIPMKLDSFYVSLLSQKYKTGSSNFVKSYITGYKSNNYAKKHNNNYSSLIYVVSK